MIESIGFSLINAAFCFILILSPLFQPYGYSPLLIAAMGGIFIIFGLISSIITGVLLDKYRCYLKLYRAICAGTAITFALMLATFPSGNVWLVGVNLAIAGAVVIPIMPIGVAFACELTFPLSETVTNGLI